MQSAAKTVLVVDDDVEFAEMLRMRLAAGNYRVVTARNGKEGLARAKEESPDVILLDVMMPGMDGGDVALAMRQNPKLAAIPIIFLTAAVSEKETKAHKGLIGGEFFIAKTADLRRVVNEIETCLAQRLK